MVFCNTLVVQDNYETIKRHNPYFNRWFSAISFDNYDEFTRRVTILILIDGFLQYKQAITCNNLKDRHNPYFNRWFSAIRNGICLFKHIAFVTILILIDGFLQYSVTPSMYADICSHNPYFNRWFSAIIVNLSFTTALHWSQSLF